MHLPGTEGREKGDGARLQQLWRQVCAARGTPAPNPARLDGFMAGLDALEQNKLESVLSLAARGREQPGDLSVISWAAACTRPALHEQLAAHGLGFTSAALFACGLKLREEGWDMQQRLAQLAAHPADVDTLRGLLPVEPDQAEGDLPTEAGPDLHEEMAVDKPFFPWPNVDDNGLPGGQGPGGNEAPVESMDNSPAAPHEPRLRLRLRLFGKSAAHTLEVTPHRRGGDFLGAHVVSIDSAHALGAGGGYAWERKLVLQLTSEEMPAVIATLMGLTPSVRFGHHGAGRDKFLEVRRQEGGLVMVTGEKALSYSVPVPAATLYYVLDLFCRAMAIGMEVDKPEHSVSDVLMLVKTAHGL